MQRTVASAPIASSSRNCETPRKDNPELFQRTLKAKPRSSVNGVLRYSSVTVGGPSVEKPVFYLTNSIFRVSEKSLASIL
jgi:hypothetical protein